MKQFQTAARRGTSAMTTAQPVEFEYEVSEGNFVVMRATPPTSGQLALFMTHQMDGGLSTVQALFTLLSAVLRKSDYDIIEGQLHDGLDLAVITEIVEYLVAEWSGRPTRPPSGSSPSRPTTGRRSTVKQPVEASTTSN